MNTNLAMASLLGATLLASPAIAQSTAPNNQPPANSPPAQTQTEPPATASSGSTAGANFVTQQSLDQWRAPKLVGVDVYGPDGKKVGSIKDVMIDHEGQAQIVVIGVGGVLGIGTKDVGLPFNAIRWQTEGRQTTNNSKPGTNSVGAMTGGPNNPPATERTNPKATEANQGYPDKAIISMNEDQLKSAPSFNYAPNPQQSSADMHTPATSGEPQHQKTTTP
jgi:sporulation protein YlmC with PRC-barrel domain